MIVVAVVAVKGGVGKSTIVANLGVGLSRRGRTVLAVDLDPQNALHLHMGGKPEDITGLSRASVAGTSWSDVCVRTNSGVNVLPFGRIDDTNLSALERQIAGDPRWLAHNLQRLELPDDAVVILDTPPGVSNYLRQALGEADLVISVMLADAASYATLPQIEQLIRRHQGPRPGNPECIYIINQADDARPLSTESVDLIQRVLGERVIGVVHVDRFVSEALACGQTVVESSADSIGRGDLMYCADEVLSRLEMSSGAV
jgi:cellulose synthase operon protein YhjQ